MKFNKNSRGYRYITDIKERYTIGDVTVKISRSCVKAVDTFLGHIKKYKRVYGLIVKYVAFVILIGLIPELVKWIQSVDWFAVREYLRTDAIHEIDKLAVILTGMLQKFAYLVMWLLVVREVVDIKYGKSN